MTCIKHLNNLNKIGFAAAALFLTTTVALVHAGPRDTATLVGKNVIHTTHCDGPGGSTPYESADGPGLGGGYLTSDGPGVGGGYLTSDGPGLGGGYLESDGPGLGGGY